jgi:hypothetical protein
VLALIALLVVGVAVIAVAAALLLRRAQVTEPREEPYPDRERGEREVYDQLYGKRSLTVSAPRPVEAPPNDDADGPRAHTSSAERR